MNVHECIINRRSTRDFKNDVMIEDGIIKQVIESGMHAPSAKNRQPWNFIVISHTEQLINIMYDKYNEIKDYKDPGSLLRTIKCMGNCSRIILIFNNQLSTYYHGREFRRHRWLADVQSIGACIQNMLLTCEELELGSLWVCDVLYADKEIVEFYKRTDELIAAVAIGGKGSIKHTNKYFPEFDQIVEWY